MPHLKWKVKRLFFFIIWFCKSNCEITYIYISLEWSNVGCCVHGQIRNCKLPSSSLKIDQYIYQCLTRIPETYVFRTMSITLTANLSSDSLNFTVWMWFLYDWVFNLMSSLKYLNSVTTDLSLSLPFADLKYKELIIRRNWCAVMDIQNSNPNQNSIDNRLIFRYSLYCLILVNQSQYNDLDCEYLNWKLFTHVRVSLTFSRISLKSFNRAICVGSQFMNIELLWFLLWLPKQNNIQRNDTHTDRHKKNQQNYDKNVGILPQLCSTHVYTTKLIQNRKKIFYRWLIE